MLRYVLSYVMKCLVLSLLILTASTAWSQTAWLHVNGHSYHNRSGFNETNRGLGMELMVSSQWSVAGGVYRNSIDRDSVYALTKYHWYRNEDWAVNINIGGVTGYRGWEVAPVILPEACWLWLCGFVIPRLGDDSAAAAAFYLRIPIK